MCLWCFSLIVMAAATLGIVAALTEMKMGKFKSKVNNHGEIEFEGGAGVNGTRKAHPVRIRIDELVQIDTNGNDLASCTEATNPTKPGMGWMKNKARKAAMKKRLRKFRGFANQTFVVGARKLKAAMRNGGGMKAAMQRFSASLPDAMGKMVIKLVMPEEAGEVDIGGEKQKLKIGDTKFNIEMSEWNWCDNSAFIDVYVVVSSKKHPMKRHPRGKTVPATYNLGDNMTLSFSGKFQKDGAAWADMAEGYPKVDPTSPNRFIVRFPRFEKTLVYDPTLAGDVDENSSDTTAVRMSAILVALATQIMVYSMLE